MDPQQLPVGMMDPEHTAADAQGEGSTSHLENEDQAQQGSQDMEEEAEAGYGEPPLTELMAPPEMQDDGGIGEEPRAPKVLYRSTTGKGIAFTREDVDFLVRFLRFRQ